MRFGTKIRMLRTYDAGSGLVEGRTFTVGTGDGQVRPSLADQLVDPGKNEPFAEIVDRPDVGGGDDE